MKESKKLIVANWKMNKNLASAKIFFESFPPSSPAVICPPFTLLEYVSKAYNKLGAQDCSQFSQGAHTGDVSAAMIKDIGCNYVILGHSERRQYHKESTDIIKKKIINAHEAGLIVILCFGESLDTRETKDYKQILCDDVINCVTEATSNANIVFAYEPLWAIGTGKTASPEEIAEVHEFLSEKIVSRFAFLPKILYGGSVNLDNAESILKMKSVGGLLIGGASLDPNTLYKIIKISERENLCS